MQKLFHVYMIKNNINNKIYIGKTSGDHRRRWNRHIKIAEGNGCYAKFIKYAIHVAIIKYGKENFTFSIIKSFLNENDAYSSEIFYIKKYDSIKNGYNRTIGGNLGGAGEYQGLSKFSSTQILDIFQEFINKKSILQISKNNNCSKSTINDILNRVTHYSVVIDSNILNMVKKIKLQNKKTPLNMLNSELITSDYLSGLSYRQIVKKYNSSTFIISKIIKKNVDESIINKNKMQPICKKFADVVINDYINSDLTAIQIGDKYKKSKYVIYDILRGKTVILDSETLSKIKMISKIKSSRKSIKNAA